MALARRMRPHTAAFYVPAQIAGGIAGTFLAHAMFALPILAEGVATFGLVLTILGCRARSDLTIAAAAGLYIAAAQCTGAIIASFCFNWIFSKNSIDIKETSAKNSSVACAFCSSQDITKSAMF